MKFYRPRGSHLPAVQWDPNNECAIWEFIGGVFETEDPKLIAKMEKLGFSTEPISANVQAAMEITRDMTQPQPPPPPDEKKVPAMEPQLAKPKAAPIIKAAPLPQE